MGPCWAGGRAPDCGGAYQARAQQLCPLCATGAKLFATGEWQAGVSNLALARVEQRSRFAGLQSIRLPVLTRSEHPGCRRSVSRLGKAYITALGRRLSARVPQIAACYRSPALWRL